MHFSTFVYFATVFTFFVVADEHEHGPNLDSESHVKIFPFSSSPHPLVSNWNIKLLASQGIFMGYLNTQYFADSYVYVELVYNEKNEMDESFFNFTLKSRKIIVPGTKPYRDLEQLENTNIPKPLSSFARLGNVLEPLREIDQQLKLKLNKTLSIPYDSDLYLFLDIVVKEELNFYGSLAKQKSDEKLILKLYVRDTATTVKFIRLQFLETRYPARLFTPTDTGDNFDSILCTPWHVEEPKSWYQKIAFEKDGLIYYTTPYQNIDCYTRSICMLPKSLMDSWEPDPCLTSIHQNKSIDEIQSKCKLNCRKEYPPEQDFQLKRPKVIEVGDTLYISYLNAPITRICRNNSLDITILPPPAGALGMKIPCLCKIEYNDEFKLLWSRYNTEGDSPYCTNNASETFEVFQALASEFVKLDHINISKSELDSQLFLNLSGHIIGRELVETLLEDLKNNNGSDNSYWNDWFFNLAISLIIVVAIEFCRSRGFRQNVVQQQVVAQFFPARRRRKG